MRVGLDGVDFNLWSLGPGCTTGGAATSTAAIAWITAATTAAYNALSPTSRFVTHAPFAPFFGAIGGSSWSGPSGCYSAVAAQVGGYIDWYNVQVSEVWCGVVWCHVGKGRVAWVCSRPAWRRWSRRC